MTKPVPKITDINRLYFEGCAQGELRIRHCPNCGARFRFAHEWCPSCWSLELDWERSTGRGTVSHVTVVHQAPYPAFEDIAPYALVLLDLEEGVRMMSNVIDCPADEVRIGMRVKAVFVQRGDVIMPMFVPDAP